MEQTSAKNIQDMLAEATPEEKQRILQEVAAVLASSPPSATDDRAKERTANFYIGGARGSEQAMDEEEWRFEPGF